MHVQRWYSLAVQSLCFAGQLTGVSTWRFVAPRKGDGAIRAKCWDYE